MYYGTLTICLSTGFVLSSYAESLDTPLPTVTIDAGEIVGTTTSLSTAATLVNQFLGIPFAASPPERFAPPEKPTQWPQPLDTKERKPACVQQFNYPEANRDFVQQIFNHEAPEESEDCLYLNVFAPASPPAGKGRAVLYWIYGGGLQFGYAGLEDYDDSFFAAFEDVIIVTVNYRTNVFGFPNSPELPLTGQNLGFLDQRLGLDWVQRNIQAFGGDPEKVTVFGESAGAFSIDALLTSYPKDSSPPFRAAILQSGQVSYPNPFYTDTTAAWYQLAASLNCTNQSSNLTCIKAASATAIKDAIEHGQLTFNPVYDNVTAVANPAKRRSSGNIANIPVLSGTVAQEGRVLAYSLTNLTAYLVSLGLESDFITEVEAAYPVGGSEFPTEFDAIAQVTTDFHFQCPSALFATSSATSGIPSWRYYFNASFPNTQDFPNAGVYHSSEIRIVFGTYPTRNVTAQEYALSNFMRGAWARFAKDPAAGPGWNAVGMGSGYYGGNGDLDLGVLGAHGSSGVKLVRQSEVDGRCKIWEPLLTAGT